MSDVPVWTLAVAPVVGGMLAIAGGWLQSRLTRKKDRAESIWDRKAQAYIDGMYVLDAALAPRTRSSPVPDKVGGVNREELLRARAALQMFGTEGAAANFNAAVVIILDLDKQNVVADQLADIREAVSTFTDAFKMDAHRDLGLKASIGWRPGIAR